MGCVDGKLTKFEEIPMRTIEEVRLSVAEKTNEVNMWRRQVRDLRDEQLKLEAEVEKISDSKKKALKEESKFE